MLFLKADYNESIINYAKVKLTKLDGARFGASLANTFDIDGNGEYRVGGMGW